MLRKSIYTLTALLAVGTIVAVLPVESFAGRIGGPMRITGTAAPNDYDVYTARFQAGRVAHIYVKSMNTADLDVKIIDPVTLRVVAQDLRPARDAHVDFVPNATREYIIVIHNFSQNRGTAYTLTTN